MKKVSLMLATAVLFLSVSVGCMDPADEIKPVKEIKLPKIKTDGDGDGDEKNKPCPTGCA